MGIFSAFKLSNTPRPDYLASPFTEGQLSEIVWSDVFGLDFAPLSRADALAIPAVSKARDLITATVASFPLVVLNKDGELPDEQQPTWTYRTDGAISPFLRMVYTVDNLMFYGRALWRVTRGAEGQILTAEWVPFEQWKVNPDGKILIEDVIQQAEEIIYFPHFTSGLLDRASVSLKAARNIEAAVSNRVSNPIPVTELHQTTDEVLTKKEKDALVASYNKARRDPEGTTVFTPFNVELKTHGDKADSGFAVEGRNASRLDVANLTGVPASLLEGSTSSASLTYSTAEGKRNEFIDYGLLPWLNTVQSRLSQDDVVPRGQRIRFDLSEFLTPTPSPTGAAEQD